MRRKRTIGLIAVAVAAAAALIANQSGTAFAATLRTDVPPGGNFDLSVAAYPKPYRPLPPVPASIAPAK